MCYKILKATKICMEGHLLEGRACWRQCKVITGDNEFPAWTRCKDITGMQITIRIDVLHRTPKVQPAQCKICTPYHGAVYLQKQRTCASAQQALTNATARLQTCRDAARRYPNPPEASRVMVEHYEKLKTGFQYDLQKANNELTQEAERIKVLAQRSVENSLRRAVGDLRSDRPIFYYGPTIGAEITVRRLNAPSDLRLKERSIPADSSTESIIDWSDGHLGGNKMMLYSNGRVRVA